MTFTSEQLLDHAFTYAYKILVHKFGMELTNNDLIRLHYYAQVARQSRNRTSIISGKWEFNAAYETAALFLVEEYGFPPDDFTVDMIYRFINTNSKLNRLLERYKTELGEYAI